MGTSTPVTTITPAGPLSADYRALSIGVCSLILGLAFEFMAVATALPVAAKELGGLGLYPWALTGFLGAAMFANGVAGEVCDRVGPRLPVIFGSVTFGVGLLVSGLAQSMPILILGRVVQGLGAGFMIVAVYVVIAQCYPDASRPRMMSLLATTWVVPSVVGPFIAGALTELASWRWAFLALAPLVPLPLIAVLPRISSTVGSNVRRSGRVRLAATMAVGAALLQWAGIEAE
ncbi:MAG: MFS transporter, partial [Nocardioidaceae bacterium]|nr:MFS transporter [Nocardioidaceae bacterium]